MRHVVVTENLLLAVRLAHAFNHRIVVERIRQDQTVRHQLRQRGNAGLVGDIAGGKDQRRFLAVQVGELAFEFDQRMIVAGDVARAACAGAHPGRGLDHRADHLRVLPHAEVIVRAPDHDVLRALRRMPDRVRETARDPLKVGKYPIPALVPQPAERIGEIGTIVHECPAFRGSRRTQPQNSFLEGFQANCRGDCRRKMVAPHCVGALHTSELLGTQRKGRCLCRVRRRHRGGPIPLTIQRQHLTVPSLA